MVNDTSLWLPVMTLPFRTSSYNPQFVGRTPEFDLLHQALLGALSGHGALALVTGEAGIGKTTLVEAVAREARRRGALTLTGQCYDLDVAPPYGPWQELAQQVLAHDDLPPPPAALLDEAAAKTLSGPEELRAAACRHIAALAEHGPLLLIFEDAHWADQASLDLLRSLGRRLTHQAILLIVTYRDVDLSPEQPLYRIVPNLVRESRPLRIDLRPLDAVAVEVLVSERYALASADAARLVDYLERTAEGNPFFIGELLISFEHAQILQPTTTGWALGDIERTSVPLLLRQVIDRQLERVSEPTRRALQVAALIGLEVPTVLWRDAVDQPLEQMANVIEEAIMVQALTESTEPATLRFRHALIRQALSEELLLPRRNAWHRRIGEVLADRPRADPDGPAYHFWRANDQRAIPWLLKAGDRARALYAPAAAVAHYTKAFHIAATFSIEIPAAARRARGQAYATLGDFTAAHADYLTALASARNANDRREEWRTLTDLGRVWKGRDYAPVLEFVERALALAHELGDRSLVARSQLGVGNWHINTGYVIQAIQDHERALAAFEQLGDQQGIAEAANMLALDHIIRGDMIAAATYGRRAIVVAETAQERLTHVAALHNLVGSSGIYEFATEIPADLHTAEVRQAVEQAIALADGMSWHAGEGFGHSAFASQVGFRGDYGLALVQARQALEIVQEIEHKEWTTLANIVLGEILLDVLAWEDAEQVLTAAFDLAATFNSFVMQRLATASLARLLVATGDSQRAEEVLAPVLGDLDKIETSIERACWRAQAEVALAAGAPETTLQIADRLIATTANGTPEQIAPPLGCLRAAALLALDRPNEVDSTLAAAERVATRFELRPQLWRIHKLRSEAYARQQRHDESRHERAAQQAVIHEIAGTLPDDHLRDQFLSRAIGPHNAPSYTSTDILSARELEVLQLAAQGLTNNEIADQLSISPRTVKGHLQSIYTKLDVNTRTAATAYAFAHRLM